MIEDLFKAYINHLKKANKNKPLFSRRFSAIFIACLVMAVLTSIFGQVALLMNKDKINVTNAQNKYTQLLAPATASNAIATGALKQSVVSTAQPKTVVPSQVKTTVVMVTSTPIPSVSIMPTQSTVKESTDEVYDLDKKMKELTTTKKVEPTKSVTPTEKPKVEKEKGFNFFSTDIIIDIIVLIVVLLVYGYKKSKDR